LVREATWKRILGKQFETIFYDTSTNILYRITFFYTNSGELFKISEVLKSTTFDKLEEKSKEAGLSYIVKKKKRVESFNEFLEALKSWSYS